MKLDDAIRLGQRAAFECGFLCINLGHIRLLEVGGGPKRRGKQQKSRSLTLYYRSLTHRNSFALIFGREGGAEERYSRHEA